MWRLKIPNFKRAQMEQGPEEAPPFRSLRLRLLQPLLLLSVLAAMAACLGIYLITGTQLRQELQLRGEMLSSAIVIAAETNATLGDFHRTLLAMASERTVEHIALVDLDYQPIFNDDSPHINDNTSSDKRDTLDALAQQALLHNTSVGAIDRHNSALYQVLTPVYITALQQKNALRPKPALLIISLITTESERKAYTTTILLTLLFSGVGLAALLMVYFLMNHWVLKPSFKIVEVMQTHNLGLVATTGFQPIHELGLIGQTFDNLAKTLDARERALEHALQKAQEASLAKSQFLANMSHELRTPMNAILGMLALLRKTELTAQQGDYALKSEGAARSLLGLLNDILDISKAEAGKMELDPTPFNLDHLTRDLGVILASNLSLATKPVEVVFNTAPELPRYFVGDALRLQQVLINLGGNAIKFTERGTVTINITSQGQQGDEHTLHFSVQDSGIGIAPENQAKIFSGFTQAEASTTRRFGGTGLGLAISQRLVALMGGRLELESALGCGARFFFSLKLPLLNGEGIAALNTASQLNAPVGDQQRLHAMRILLVEDNLNNQQIAQELLEAEGARVHIAQHGQEALDMLHANPQMIDAVLMDLQMPVMDGLTATRAIRTDLGLTALPIIAMTANAMSTDRESCIDAGMNDHVGKPFDLNHLVAVLRHQTHWQAHQPRTASPANTNSADTPNFVPTKSLNTAEIAAKNGVDLTSALKRLGNNKKLYLKMLPKVAQDLEKLPQELHALFEQGDQAGLARALHSLKGLAATMGLTALSNHARTGEHQVLNTESHADIPEMLQQMTQNISATVIVLNDLLAAFNAEG
jgi:signal transduction histidine kinase/DNA-binding response OmpR family regulator/HPt (histidine-containing phosphotransfer) domain-containing protein